ncbi:D-glycero-beta-D-manno-heptose 1,7-bisphosphate 7-phosphatase [Kaarinaea lacus]
MKLVILDRDGVINYDSDEYIKSPEEFIPLPGSLEAIARLNQAGYIVVVATNQSGVARGYFSEQTLAQMHAKLEQLLAQVGGKIDAIYYCPHGPDDHCDCRKPKPGLLQKILQKYDTNVSRLPVIGDSLRDLQAALAVGAQPMLVKTGKGERTIAKLAQESELKNVPIFADLNEAVNYLLTGIEK